MRKLFKMTYAIGFCLLFMSCVSTNRNRYLKNGKVLTGDYTNYEKGYTLKIPDTWVGFLDTHSQFAYKPKISIEQKPYIVVRVMNGSTLKVDDNITNLEEFTNEYVKNIVAKNVNPNLNVSYQEHNLYKKYSVVSYKTSFLGNNYTSLAISFYYNSKPFRISYFAQKDEFANYLEDFTNMLETFRITE